MKTKHTPAPWHIGIRQPTSDKFIYGSKGEEIADCDRKTNFPDENLSNARLIAAAPELLEFLKIAIRNYEDAMHSEFDFPNNDWSLEREGNDDLIAAKKLIMKLEGES